MENKEIEINKTPLTLQQWSDSNHLYLSDELLDNVDKWLREISTHNYEKNAKESWKEYLDDHEEELNELYKNNINGVEKEMTKQNILATEKDFDENNRYIGETGAEAVIEVNLDVLKSIGKDLSGMFEDVEAKGVKFK